MRKENIFKKMQYPVNCKDENSGFITHNPTFALQQINYQFRQKIILSTHLFP